MLPKLETKLTTQDLCQFAALEAEPTADSMAPAGYIEHLLATDRGAEAVRFLAQALTPESAVRWALRCAKHFANHDAASGFHAIEAWLQSPVDAKRRAAKEAAEKSGLDNPAGALDMAVFFSGGSISPENAPDVPPPPHVCQRLAAGAVILAVVSNEPENALLRFKKATELSLPAAP